MQSKNKKRIGVFTITGMNYMKFKSNYYYLFVTLYQTRHSQFKYKINDYGEVTLYYIPIHFKLFVNVQIKVRSS